MNERYRTGRRNRHLIYLQLGDQPHDDDPTVAYVDSTYADMAQVIVDLLNGQHEPQVQRVSIREGENV